MFLAHLHLPVQMIDGVCCRPLETGASVPVLLAEVALVDHCAHLLEHEQATEATPANVGIHSVHANEQLRHLDSNLQPRWQEKACRQSHS